MARKHPRMDFAAAKALARAMTDPDANPPIKAVPASNGPHHNAVVHVTFGEPKLVTKTDKNGTETTTTPKRPMPYTVS